MFHFFGNCAGICNLYAVIDFFIDKASGELPLNAKGLLKIRRNMLELGRRQGG